MREIQTCAFDNSDLIEIDGCFETATVIGDFAFSACPLKTIELPALQEMGDYAFQYCPNLERFVVPTSCHVIPDGCFALCPALSELVLHPLIDKIGSEAFAQSALETIQWPTACKAVPANCFSDSSLTNIEGLENVERINNEAFSGCVNLNNFAWPAKCIRVANEVFEDCSALNNIEGLDKVITIGKRAFSKTGFSPESPLDISRSSVQSIDINAFLA